AAHAGPPHGVLCRPARRPRVRPDRLHRRGPRPRRQADPGAQVRERRGGHARRPHPDERAPARLVVVPARAGGALVRRGVDDPADGQEPVSQPMFRLALPWPDTSLLLTPQWSGLVSPVLQALLLLLVVAVPLGLVLWLYRYELRLVSRAT